MANEVVDHLVGDRRKGLFHKLDKEKVCDHFSWEFVDYMLDIMGFGGGCVLTYLLLLLHY